MIFSGYKYYHDELFHKVKGSRFEWSVIKNNLPNNHDLVKCIDNHLAKELKSFTLYLTETEYKMLLDIVNKY